MNEAQKYSAFAIESRLLPEIRALLAQAGRPDLAKLLQAEQALGASPYHAAVVKSAKRQVERVDTVSFPDDGVVIPGDFQGERMVLAWVSVNLAKLSESLIAHANGVPLPEGIALGDARRKRGEFLLMHYPYTHEIIGGSDWVEDRHNDALSIAVWGKDPDRPYHQIKHLLVLSFKPQTSTVESVRLQ